LKLLYQISNNPTHALIPSTFNFDVGGIMFLTSVTNGTTAATLSADLTVGSDAGSAQSDGSMELVSFDSGAPYPETIRLFTATSDSADVNRLGITGYFTASVEASQFILLEFDLGVNVEAAGGDTYDKIIMNFDSATVPADFMGPIPILTNSSGPPIPVTVASAEPPTLGFTMIALAILALFLFRRS
jgi:hypothetical protein